MDKQLCHVSLHGCDDTTSFDVLVDEVGIELLKELEEKSRETSTYWCMPIFEAVLHTSNCSYCLEE